MAKIEKEGHSGEDKANQFLRPEFRQYTRETPERSNRDPTRIDQI